MNDLVILIMFCKFIHSYGYIFSMSEGYIVLLLYMLMSEFTTFILDMFLTHVAGIHPIEL